MTDCSWARFQTALVEQHNRRSESGARNLIPAAANGIRYVMFFRSVATSALRELIRNKTVQIQQAPPILAIRHKSDCSAPRTLRSGVRRRDANTMPGGGDGVR
jgi:hypothetical protein